MSAIQKLPLTSNLSKLLAEHELEQKAVETLEECLGAECKVYDMANKELVTYADGKTRLNAALGILAYTAGKPIERKEIITHNADSLESLTERVRKSPELRKKIREMFDEGAVELSSVTR